MTKLKSGTKRIPAMPVVKLERLNGYNLAMAMEEGLITSVGHQDKGFIFGHKDENIDRHYAVIDGSVVICSPGLVKAVENEEIEAGDMVIEKHQSLKRYSKDDTGNNVEDEDGEFLTTFRLQLPGGYNLDIDNGLMQDVYESEPAGAQK